MAKYLIRRMNKNITKDTIDEYTNNPLHVSTVSGKVSIIVKIRTNEINPDMKIALNFSAPRFLLGSLTSLLSSAI